MTLFDKKAVKYEAGLDRKDDTLGIIQKIEIWPYY